MTMQKLDSFYLSCDDDDNILQSPSHFQVGMSLCLVNDTHDVFGMRTISSVPQLLGRDNQKSCHATSSWMV